MKEKVRRKKQRGIKHSTCERDNKNQLQIVAKCDLEQILGKSGSASSTKSGVRRYNRGGGSVGRFVTVVRASRAVLRYIIQERDS